MKKILSVFIVLVAVLSCFAAENSIVVKNEKFKVEDELYFTNTTGKDIPIAISVKKREQSPERFVVNAVVPAGVKNYEIDNELQHDFDLYEYIIVTPEGKISSYKADLKRDCMYFSINEFKGSDEVRKFDNEIILSAEYQDEDAEDYFKVNNKTDRDIQYTLYGTTKKGEHYCCSGTLKAAKETTVFVLSSIGEKYGDFSSFRFCTDVKLEKYSSAVERSDLNLTINSCN